MSPEHSEDNKCQASLDNRLAYLRIKDSSNDDDFFVCPSDDYSIRMNVFRPKYAQGAHDF